MKCVCVCVCMYVCICAHGHAHMHLSGTHMEVKGQPWMLMLTSSSFETSPLICCSLLSAAGSWPQTLWGFSCPFLPSHCGRTEVEITGTCCCSWFLHRFRDLNLGSHVAQQVVYLLGDHPSPYNNLKECTLFIKSTWQFSFFINKLLVSL